MSFEYSKYLRNFFLLLIILVFCAPVEGQYRKRMKRYEAKAGYGYFQGFHAAFNYFYNSRMNAGIALGSHFGLPPLDNENHFNISIEHNLFFGIKNRQQIKPWIFNQQIMYWEQGPPDDRWRLLSPALHLGRKFALTDQLGLSVEIGQAFNIVVDRKREPLTPEAGWMWPILYNGRVQVYYCW